NVTKLEWQIGIPATYPGCSEAVENGPAGGLCTRLEGETYCADLTYGGHDDWRLPPFIELNSLLYSQRPGGPEATDSRDLGDPGQWAFVSDPTSANAPSSIWSLNYYARVSRSLGAYAGKVRGVRAGAEPPFATPADRYALDTSADTVSDRATGLVWQRTASAT